MASVTRASTSLPAAGGDMDAEPLTDQITNILTFVESTNIDEANVDLSGTDGIVGKSTAQTITGLKSFENTSAAAGGIREVARFGIDPATGTPTDADGGRLVFYADDAGGAETDILRFDWVMTDTANASEDARFDLYAIVAGTIGTVLELGYDDSGTVVNVIQTREAIAAAVRDALILEWDPDGGGNGTDDSTGVALAFRMPDDADAQDIFARITALMSDDAAGTEDCTLRFGVITAGTLANEVQITGAATSPVTNDGNALGTTSLGWADLHLATGGVINWANGEITITETDADTLTIAGVATRLDLAAGILEVNNAVEWDTGVAVVAGEYSIGRDADVTNQLHFNIPTGATFEWSVNDVAEMLLSVSNLTPGANDGNALGSATVSWADLFLASGGVINFDNGDVTATHSANTLAFAGAASGYTFDTVVYINDTANAGMTIGLTINQGANDNDIINLKSSSVIHGITSHTETDTWARFTKQSATAGGAMFGAYSSGTIAVNITGIGTTDVTTKAASGGNAYIHLDARKKSGTTADNPGADANLVSILSAGTTTFIFDREGSAHADVEWIAFDSEDDLQLVADIESLMVPEIFGEAVRYREDDLVSMKLFGENSIRREPNGKMRGMMNQTRMIMLHHGTLHKIYHVLKDQTFRIEFLENRLKLLEAA